MSTSAVTPCLVPVDTSSDAEEKLFIHQRKICGWKHRVVPEMFKQMSQGRRTIYWLCTPAISRLWVSMTGADVVDEEEGPDYMERDLAFEVPLLDPSRALPSLPSSTLSQNGTYVSGTNTNGSSNAESEKIGNGLLPIGHISLDYEDLDYITTPLLGSKDGRIVSITTLFVLPTFRKFGVAKWAMDELERLATSGNTGDHVQKMKCQQIGLSTLSVNHFTTPGPEGMGMWARFGLPGVGLRPGGVKSRYLGDWYRSLGYEKILEMRKFREWTPDGEEAYWWGEIWGKRIDGGTTLLGLDDLKNV